jgi:hypothetical protein
VSGGGRPAGQRRPPVARPRPAEQPSGRRITPGVIFLAIAVVGSIAYMGYAITVREASQIPLLASGAVVLGIAFAALAVYCLHEVLQAGTDGRGGRAMVLALVGGGAAIATGGCFAAAIILFQLASSGTVAS